MDSLSNFSVSLNLPIWFLVSVASYYGLKTCFGVLAFYKRVKVDNRKTNKNKPFKGSRRF